MFDEGHASRARQHARAGLGVFLLDTVLTRQGRDCPKSMGALEWAQHEKTSSLWLQATTAESE
jgi:hypothetical protein